MSVALTIDVRHIDMLELANDMATLENVRATMWQLDDSLCQTLLTVGRAVLDQAQEAGLVDEEEPDDG